MCAGPELALGAEALGWTSGEALVDAAVGSELFGAAAGGEALGWGGGLDGVAGDLAGTYEVGGGSLLSGAPVMPDIPIDPGAGSILGSIMNAGDAAMRGWQSLGTVGQQAVSSLAMMALMGDQGGALNAKMPSLSPTAGTGTVVLSAPSLGAGGLGVSNATIPNSASAAAGTGVGGPAGADPTAPGAPSGSSSVLSYNPRQRSDTAGNGVYGGALDRSFA